MICTRSACISLRFTAQRKHSAHRQNYQECAEEAAKDIGREYERDKSAEDGSYDGGQYQPKKAIGADETLFFVDGKRKGRHRQKGYEVCDLCDMLADAAEHREGGDHNCPPAHPHAADKARQKARSQIN